MLRVRDSDIIGMKMLEKPYECDECEALLGAPRMAGHKTLRETCPPASSTLSMNGYWLVLTGSKRTYARETAYDRV